MPAATAKVVNLSDPTAGGNETILHSIPFTVSVTLEGTADLLFHRWNCEAVEEKAKAAKNSAGKKEDNVESYVYRNDREELCIPGEYLRCTIVNAARFRQDPRSPRKSAMDLFKAAIVSLTPLATLGVKEWNYLDKRRVQVQRNGINRVRPAISAGWMASFQLMSLLPEYVDAKVLREVIEQGGRLVGLADFRPTYGRYGITNYEVL